MVKKLKQSSIALLSVFACMFFFANSAKSACIRAPFGEEQSIICNAACGASISDCYMDTSDGTFFEVAGCGTPCTVPGPVCGDGVQEGNEQCDDGNTAPDDGCDGMCHIEPICGDGNVDAGEECDDGNTNPYDGCSPNCENEGCIRAPFGAEEAEVCLSACGITNCFINQEGFYYENGACSTPCSVSAPPVCGDGVVNGMEQCDDNNDTPGDGCDDQCQIEFICGNGIVEGDEECDDNNTDAHDGCNSACVIETCNIAPFGNQISAVCNQACGVPTCYLSEESIFYTDTVCGNMCIGPDTLLCNNQITLNFSSLSKGEIVENQFNSSGITISASNNHSGHPDKAIIFDSANPSGSDNDLGTPNQAFAGPGQGSGGASEPGANDESLGNILIIAEDIVDNSPSDGLVDDPDDEADGGIINIDFSLPVKVLSMKAIDMDEAGDSSGNRVRALDSGSAELKVVNFSGYGDNSLELVDIDQVDVSRLEINLKSSGAIDEITYCGGECGNGVLEIGEECDDDNTTSGDGCSDTCTIEQACSNQVMYAIHDKNSDDSVLFKYDMNTKVATHINTRNNYDIEAFDLKEDTGLMYGISGDINDSPKRLLVIDPVTGIPSNSTGIVVMIDDDNDSEDDDSDSSSSSDNYEFESGSFNPLTHVLWTSGDNANLRTVNLSTGDTTLVKTLGYDVEAMAWNPEGTYLYMYRNSNNKVIRYNPVSDAIEDVCTLVAGAGEIESMEFDPSGNLVTTFEIYQGNYGEVGYFDLNTCAISSTTEFSGIPSSYNDIEAMTFVCD